MNTQTITGALAVKIPAGDAAHRAIRNADQANQDPKVRAILHAYRWAESASNAPGLTDEQVNALSDQAALVWGMLTRAKVASRDDAVCKLRAVSDSFEMGERLDGTDGVILNQVIDWLIHGGLN